MKRTILFLSQAEVEQSNSEEKEDSIYSLPEISFYERNAVALFAGFVASKCFLKTNCEKCREDTLKTPMEERKDSEHYIRQVPTTRMKKKGRRVNIVMNN